jgi:hypothetical protein
MMQQQQVLLPPHHCSKMALTPCSKTGSHRSSSS